MKAVFAALMKHKESRKYKLLNHAVNNDMDPGIKSLEEHNYDKSNRILNTQKYRACKIVSTMLAKQLYSFWQKWIDETQHKRVLIAHINKIKTPRFFNSVKGFYFNKWKSNSFNKINQIAWALIQNKMRENEALQREAM